MADVAAIDSYDINCTGTVYTECRIAYWLWRTIPFTLLGIGLFGNILNFVVLSRQRLRRYSTTVYLIFLAGTDMVFLLFGLMPDVVYSITGIRFADYSLYFCRIRVWVVYTSGSFSVWLLVLLTLERVLLTKAPLAARTRLTPKTSLFVSVVMFIVLTLANIHCITGFKHHLSKEELMKEFGTELVQVLHFPCTYASKEYMIFFTGTWGLIILTVFNILPAVIIVIGNVTIAGDIIMRKKRLNKVNPTKQNTIVTEQQTNELTMTQTYRNSSFQAQSSKHGEIPNNERQPSTVCKPTESLDAADTSSRYTHQQRDQQGLCTRLHGTKPAATRIKVKMSHSPTRMLFTLTIFFIVTTFPYTLYFALKAGLSDLSEKEIARWQLITVIALIFGWCNYSFNFFLYFVSGNLFKQEWRRLLGEGKFKLRNMFC